MEPITNPTTPVNLFNYKWTSPKLLHAFTVFGSNRYREDADQKSWERFKEFLADTLKN